MKKSIGDLVWDEGDTMYDAISFIGEEINEHKRHIVHWEEKLKEIYKLREG